MEEDVTIRYRIFDDELEKFWYFIFKKHKKALLISSSDLRKISKFEPQELATEVQFYRELNPAQKLYLLGILKDIEENKIEPLVELTFNKHVDTFKMKFSDDKESEILLKELIRSSIKNSPIEVSEGACKCCYHAIEIIYNKIKCKFGEVEIELPKPKKSARELIFLLHFLFNEDYISQPSPTEIGKAINILTGSKLNYIRKEFYSYWKSDAFNIEERKAIIDNLIIALKKPV